MSTESLNCPNCGGPLTNAGRAATVVCDHCGSVVAVRPPAAPASAPDPSREVDPRYEYGSAAVPGPARSDLTSLALGPADASQIIQLLRDNQEQAAIQLYQSKAGVSLDDAIDAVRAIRDGLRDAPPLGQVPPAPAQPTQAVPDGPFYMPEVRRQLELGNKSAAIAAYQMASGRTYAQATAEVDRLDLQLYPGRKPAAQSGSSGCFGCSAVGLGIVALFMCVLGGCGTYLQTKSVFQCSLHQAEATLVQREVLTPPVNGGYLVMVAGFRESSSLTSSSLTADFYTPVWGGNGWGLLGGHISQSSGSRGRATVTLYKDGQTIPVLVGATVDCGQ